MKDINLERLNGPITKIGEFVLEAVKKAVSENAWKIAHFSARGSFSKLRVEMADDSINKGVRTPMSGEFFDLVDELWAIRDEFADKWHGIKVTVFPDGRCKMDLSDEEDDPNFFDY